MMGRNSCTEVELLNKDVGSNRQSAEGVQSMVHNSDSPALLNHGGFHKSDMQGQERGARLVTQGGLNKNDKIRSYQQGIQTNLREFYFQVRAQIQRTASTRSSTSSPWRA